MGAGYEIARAVEFVIANGHPEERAWKMTPRQLTAWTALAMRRKVGERAALLTVVTMAMRAEGKAIQTKLKEMMRESQ
jgi:hypothetical protein